jgi:hypothetical protein
MRSRTLIGALAAWTIAATATVVHAAPIDCGKPPPVSDEKLKLDLEADAQGLAKRIGGSAKLSLQTSRSEVLSGYPHADALLVNLYLSYEVCSIVANDPKLSAEEKVRKVEDAYRLIQTPAAQPPHPRPHSAQTRVSPAAPAPISAAAAHAASGGSTG